MRDPLACACFGALAATLLSAPARLASAADGNPPSRDAADAVADNMRPCPTKAEVLDKLVDEPSRRANFAVDSAGTVFFVIVDGVTRAFDDPGYDCERRATLAAVAITAMVSPPRSTDLGPMANGAFPAPPILQPAPSPRTTTKLRIHRWRFSGGAVTELSPGSGDHDAVAFTGLQLRAAYLPRWLGVGIGVSAFAPQTFTANGARARMTRLVPEIHVHITHHFGSFDLHATLGPALEIHDVRGASDPTTGQLRTLMGAKVACGSAFSLSSTAALQLDLSALVLPSPGNLALHASGLVGKEPSLFVGLGASLVISR